MWSVERKKAVNKYSFHGGGSSALQTPFSKGRICWSTFALQYSLLIHTASKIFSSLTIRGKTKNFILFCWKVRGRDRTRQFLWFHIIVFVVVLYAVFFVLENSPFLTEKRSTTIILPHLTNGKRKQTQSFSPRKKNPSIERIQFGWNTCFE